MPTERPARRLADIIENVERIRSYVKGMDEQAFLGDQKTRDAVERCMERIAEAARKLGDGYDGAYAELSLRDLRRFGSVLRHDYDQLIAPQMWRYIANQLDPLEAMARAELAKLPPDEPR